MKGSKETKKPKRKEEQGHRGATRKRMKPDEVIHLSMGQCPHCNHDLGEPIKTETIQTPQENKSKNGNHDLGEPIKTETKII